MTWAEWALAVLVPAVGGLAGWLLRLRLNDMQHIYDRLDQLEQKVGRVEDKLDRHITWHLGRDERA